MSKVESTEFKVAMFEASGVEVEEIVDGMVHPIGTCLTAN